VGNARGKVSTPLYSADIPCSGRSCSGRTFVSDKKSNGKRDFQGPNESKKNLHTVELSDVIEDKFKETKEIHIKPDYANERVSSFLFECLRIFSLCCN
jgi:hypothetical protein